MNINNVKFEASFGTAAQLKASDLPEIVFAGKSNVGKSSLVNKLGGGKKAAKGSSSWEAFLRNNPDRVKK